MRAHKLLVLLFVIPALVAGCNGQEPCEARPTSMAVQPDGTVACFEADGELCDEDPCDAESSHTRSKKPKPAPKTSTSRK